MPATVLRNALPPCAINNRRLANRRATMGAAEIDSQFMSRIQIGRGVKWWCECESRKKGD